MTQSRARFAALFLLAVAVLAGCDRILPQPPDMALPELDEVARVYAEHGLSAEFRYSGNVLEMVVQQPPDQLRRGGPLWARVGPYIYLFSPGTRQLFESYPALAGVRTLTMVSDVEVARALLVRDQLTDFTWRRAIAVMSHALDEGTARPVTMDRLVQFGEQHTDYAYNPDFVPPR
jgi:hypothetical protein